MLVLVSAGGDLMPVFARKQASVSQHRNKQTGGRSCHAHREKNVCVVAVNAKKRERNCRPSESQDFHFGYDFDPCIEMYSHAHTSYIRRVKLRMEGRVRMRL